MADKRVSVEELQKLHPKVDPFLIKKWERIFTLFFDKNSSNNVDWGDFYVVVRNVRILYGAESAAYSYAKKTLETLWLGLCKLGDADGDKHISIEEWVNLLVKTLNGETQWFRQYQHFMFKLFNVSGSGAMDQFEYSDGMSTYGFSEKESNDVFNRFAIVGGQKGAAVKKISAELWELRFNELFLSKDKKAIGNHMFGVINV